MRKECNIICDLLPLYVEDMVSEDTISFVEEHVKHCTECRSKMESMRNPGKLSAEANTTESSDILPMKQLKKKLKRRNIITIVITAVLTAAFGVACFYLMFMRGFSVSSDQIEVSTEFQYEKQAYLKQEFVLHFQLKEQSSLWATVKDIKENGKCVGYVVDLRAPVAEILPNPNDFTMSYFYEGDVAPEENFDFTITVRYSDKTVVYSMSEEGVFEKQENVVSDPFEMSS